MIGNTSDTCYQTFTWIIDNGAPTTTTCNEGNDFGCQSTTPNITPIPPTWVDACGFTAGQLGPTNNGCNWSVTHKFWADDECGNTSDTCYQTFTWIIDNGAPTTTTCNEGNDFGCQSTTPNITPIPPTWVDACGFTAGQLAGTPTNNGCNWSVTHKFWADDECGNTSDTCYQTFTWIIDNGAPTTTTCNEGNDFGCQSTTPNITPIPPTWVDACGFTAGQLAGTPTNNGCNWSVTHKFWADDECGNTSDTCYQTFTWIIDNGAPTTTTCNEGNDFGCQSTTPNITPIPPTWVDACGFTAGQLAGTPTNNGCNWSVTHKFWADDECGNTSDTCYQTFTWIIDNGAPTTTTCNEGNDFGCQSTTPNITPIPPTWVDACGFTAGQLVGTPTNNGCNWSVTHKFWADDECGNTSDTCYQTFTWIIDNGAPTTTTCNEGNDFGCQSTTPNITPIPPTWVDACGFTAWADDECGNTSDTCYQTFTCQLAGTPTTTNNGCNWSVTHKFWADDECGNTSDTCYQTFTWIIDNGAPTTTTCNEGNDFGCQSTTPNITPIPPTWVDACGFTAGQLAGTPTNNGCNWSWADDECGNTSDTCYQTFTWIIDNGAPTTTTCNEGNDFGCQSTTPNITPIPPTWVDACGFTAGQLAGTPTNNGCNWSVTHKFWADDECGNTSDTCYQTFTWIIDNGAPTTTTCNEGNDFGCQSTTPNITPIPPTWVDACGFTAGQLTPTNNGCNWS